MKKLKYLNLMLILLLLIVSCKKEETPKVVDANGLTKDITDLVPQEILDRMKSMGMIINGGNKPPDIQNTYIASPFTLDSSTVGDLSGTVFPDYKVTFSHQNNTDLSVLVDYTNGGEVGTGKGSFVVGDGNKFTVFVKLDVTVVNSKATAVTVISGEKTDAGIQNFHAAAFVVKIITDPDSYFIPEGNGRVFYDGDGLATRQ